MFAHLGFSQFQIHNDQEEELHHHDLHIAVLAPIRGGVPFLHKFGHNVQEVEMMKEQV